MRPLCSPLSLRRHLPEKKGKRSAAINTRHRHRPVQGMRALRTGCSQEAIGMQKIRESVLESYYT
jgi:hypothetical protein